MCSAVLPTRDLPVTALHWESRGCKDALKSLSAMGRTRKVPDWCICTILAALSCGVYLNTLQAGFTFDDFFAVVRPLSDLMIVSSKVSMIL